MLNRGLTAIGLDDLKRLLQAVHHGTLPSPISRGALIAHGLGNLEGNLDLLVGLDHTAARSVLVAVIAERTRPTPHG